MDSKSEFVAEGWNQLPDAGDESVADAVLSPLDGDSAVLITAADGVLKQTVLGVNGESVSGNWTTAAPSDSSPALGERARLTPILEDDWPKPRFVYPKDILVLDENRNLWWGRVSASAVTWKDVTPSTTLGDVKPAAGLTGADEAHAFGRNAKSKSVA